VGDSSDKNDKTQMLSDSQVIEVKPSPPKTPLKPPVEDKNDRSVWKGVVVGADEFALPTAPSSSAGRWLVVGIFAAAAIGVAAYVMWPKASAPAVLPDAAAKAVAVPAETMPQDAAAVVAPVIDAAGPEDAAVEDAARAVPAAPPDAGVKRIKRKPPPRIKRRRS
jgi:hypothetical protein